MGTFWRILGLASIAVQLAAVLFFYTSPAAKAAGWAILAAFVAVFACTELLRKRINEMRSKDSCAGPEE